MTDLTPIECEVRLVGLSKQRRKDGDWTEVKFHIHPDETPHALFILPLGTDCMLSIKGVPEKEDETTTEAPAETERPKGGERAKRAGILCNDPAFQIYMRQIGEPEKSFPPEPPSHPMKAEAARAREILLMNCFIHSMRALDHDDDAGRCFDLIAIEFWRSQRGETDAALMEQRR